MTKKNKLLSLICLAVLSIVCAFGMTFSISASTAKAELTVPVVDGSAVFGRSVSSTVGCSGAATGVRTIKTSAKNVDYVILEWTNGEGGIDGAGNQTFMYGAGQTGEHANVVSGEALAALRLANAKVQIYFALATGNVTAVVNGETEYALTAFTPVEDPANNATSISWCFHGHAADTTTSLIKVKAYDEDANYIGLNFGDRWVLSEEIVPTTAVTSTAVGKNYNANGGSKYISTANATSNDWIIFEISTVEEENVMSAQNNFYFGLGTSAGGNNATDVGVSDWSPITPLLGTGTTRYWINRITGSIYVSTNALTEAPVLRALTQGGSKRFTYKNTGLDSVYGKIFFNANVTKIDFDNVRAYDETGADLGITTSLTEEIDFPNPDVTSIEGANYVSTGAECTYFASNTATKSEWIIFDWTNANETTAVPNGANSSYCGIGTTAGNNHKTPLSAELFYIFESTNYTTVKLAYNTRDGRVFKATDGGAYALAGTILDVAFDGTTDVYASFCIHKGGNAIKMNNLKVYDGEGNDLGVKTSMNEAIALPTPDVAEITNTVDAIFNKGCGGNGYFYMDNAIANASGVGTGAKWIIFEWTNGADNAVGGGNGAFMGLQADPTRNSHAKNNVGALFTAGKDVKLYVNVENGKSYYVIDETVNTIGQLALPELTGEQFVVVSFGPHTFSGNVILTDIKCYDDLGNNLGVKVGGNGAILGSEPTIANSITGVDYVASNVEFAVNNKTATTSEWIVIEWTNGDENTAATSHNAFYTNIVTDASTEPTVDKKAAEHIARVFGAQGKNVKIYFNTLEGYMGYAVEGLTAEGEMHIVATGLNVADGATEVFGKFNTTTNAKVTGEFNGLKVYDAEGNDLGVTTTLDEVIVVPAPNTDNVSSVDLSIRKAQGTLVNKNAISEGAKWIIYDWTNGPEGSNKIGNPQNAFHLSITTNGAAGANAQPVMTGGIISAFNAHVRLMVNLENGSAYYEINGVVTKLSTLTVPALGEDQYYTVGMILNGFEYGADEETGITPTFYMNGLKVYDDLGADLGVKEGGTWLINVPTPDVSDIDGVVGKSTTSCTYIANKTATTSEWIIFEWTNLVEDALTNGANSAYVYIGTSAGCQHKASYGPELYYAFNMNQASTVKIAFNTKNGKIYKAISGGDYALAGTLADVAFDGNTPVYACFCLHKENTAEVEGLKVYDAEGNDLGVDTSFVDYPAVTAPEVDAISAIFTNACGGNGYIYMDNAIANASGVGEGAEWIIFEWTNGAENNVGGGNGSFMGIQADPQKTSHAKNNVGVLFTASAQIKLLVNIKTGAAMYFKNGSIGSIGTLTLPELTEEQYAIVSFGPHTPAAFPVVLTDVICYDDLGNNLGVKVGGNGATIATEPTITTEVVGEDINKESGKFVLNNQLPTTSEWIVFEWTNGAENTAAGGHNALYLNILADASTALTVDKMAAEHIGRIFKTADANVKLYFNTREGYMGYAIDGITADGQIHVIATGLGTTDGSTAVYAKLDTISAVGGVFNGFKCYDGEGNDLGVKTNVLPAEPNPVITEVSSIDLKLRAPQGYVASVNAPAANAKWIIFDWTNGPDGSNKINNPQNAFHLALSGDGSYAAGAQPAHTGGTISAYDTRVRIMIDLETGDAYYKLGDNKFVFFNTLALPALEEGQFVTATLLVNGLALGADEETGITPLFLMNGLKIYDDLGTDLGSKTTGNWLPNIPESTAPEGEGDEFLSKVGCTYIASATATKSEWVFIEWTNKTELAVDNGANSSYCYIGTEPGLQHKTSLGAGLWTVFNKSMGENVKLVFNTFNGNVYKSVNGGDYTFAGTVAEVANDGTTENYVCFCIHKKTNDIAIEGLKIYDAEGRDLGATFTEYKEYNVKFEVTGVALQPDTTANVKDPAGNDVLDPETGDPVTEINSRWLIYFSVTDVDNDEEIMPNLLGFGGTGHSLNINGQDVTPTYSSSMYEYAGKYTWVLYSKTIANGLNNARALAPTVVKFAEGAELGAGNYKLIISEDLYLFFSGINVVASTTGEMTEVLLKETKVGAVQDTNKRYSIGSSFTDKEGNDIAGIGLYNFFANLNGKTGTQELVLSDYQQGSNLFNYSAFTAGATTSAQVTARYYYLAKGTVIGGAYKLAEDLVLIVNGNDFRLIKAKTGGYAITYAGIGEGMSHTNPATYDYATDGFKTLAAPTVADANKKFLGWFDGNTQVTALTGITSDVTLTAKFAAASLWQAQATFKGDKFVMNFFLKSDIADLDLNAAIADTIIEGEDVTDDFDLEEGEYVYKFSLEVPVSEFNTEFSLDFVTAIGSIVLDKVENYSVAKYLDAVVALEDASDELKTLVADIKAYAYVLDADATNDNVEGMSEVATVEAGDAFARKGTNTPNYDLADPISVAYVDGKFEFTIKANVTEMNMATVDVVIGDTVINVANITGAADAEAKEYKFSVDVMQLGYMEISINVGGGAKSDVLMVNGAKFIALKSADITENKAILDRASCLVVSAQAYLAA